MLAALRRSPTLRRAQSLYEAILGRLTPVLPRLSATLLEPAIATIMDKDEIQLPDAMTTAEASGAAAWCARDADRGQAQAGCCRQCASTKN